MFIGGGSQWVQEKGGSQGGSRKGGSQGGSRKGGSREPCGHTPGYGLMQQDRRWRKYCFANLSTKSVQ